MSRCNKALRTKKLVAESHGTKCHWCQKHLVCWWRLKRWQIIKMESSRGEIEYFDKYARKQRGLMFTVDHLKPKRNGGTDNLDNLVPSCRYCNLQRDVDNRFGVVRKATGGPSQCGQQLRRYNRSVCSKCGKEGALKKWRAGTVRYCDACCDEMDRLVAEWRAQQADEKG